MGPVEIAAETRCPAREVAPHPPAGELLEELLDEVALGESLDQLELAHPDCRLARDRPGEVDRGRVTGDEEPDELVTRDERYREPRRPPAAGELGAELGKTERRARLGSPSGSEACSSSSSVPPSSRYR